jgi:hypothetical protein
VDEMSTHAAVRLAWSLCTPTVVLVAFAVYFLRIIFVTRPFLFGVVSNALVGAALTSQRVLVRSQCTIKDAMKLSRLVG